MYASTAVLVGTNKESHSLNFEASSTNASCLTIRKNNVVVLIEITI